MEGVFVAACNLHIGQPSSAQLYTSKSDTICTYLYSSDLLFYSFKSKENAEYLSQTCKPKICAFLAPSPVITIFSLLSKEYCFCKNGSLYSIPSEDAASCEPMETNMSKDDVFMDVSPERDQSTEQDSTWRVIHIHDSHKIFEDKQCKMAYPFKNFVTFLAEDKECWLIKIYKLIKLSFGSIQMQRILSVPLSCSKRITSYPYVTMIQKEVDLEADVFDCLFGKDNSSANHEWMILVSVGDGKVYSAPFAENKNREVSVSALFCLHQPVVTISKILIGTDKEGLAFIGSLGKVIILYKSDDDEKETSSVVEMHVPGPVRCWSNLQQVAFHTDGSCLWKTTFEANKISDEVSLPNLVINRIVPGGVLAVDMHANTGNQALANVVIYNEDGRLLRFQNSYLSTQSVIRLHHPFLSDCTTLKDVLTAIHECSEHLSQINILQEEYKKLLRELACSAHLLFNENVKKSLVVTVTPNWTSSEPCMITIFVKLLNSGKLAIIGNRWHFVIAISTSTGQRITKSVPIVGGLKPRNFINVITKMSLSENVITDDNMPLTLTCSLQFYVDISDPNDEGLGLATSGSYEKQSPVTFYVNLCKTYIDEVHFLCEDDAQPIPCFEVGVRDAILQMAKSRPAASLHNLETIAKPHRNVFDSTFASFIKVNQKYVEHLLKIEKFASGSTVPLNLLHYILKPSNISLNCCEDGAKATVSIFGQRIVIGISQTGPCLKMEITTSCLQLLPKIRCAILRRLQLLNSVANISHPERKFFEGFPIIQSSVKKCYSLKSLLNQSVLLPPTKQLHLIKELYKEMREQVSAELPFI